MYYWFVSRTVAFMDPSSHSPRPGSRRAELSGKRSHVPVSHGMYLRSAMVITSWPGGLCQVLLQPFVFPLAFGINPHPDSFSGFHLQLTQARQSLHTCTTPKLVSGSHLIGNSLHFRVTQMSLVFLFLFSVVYLHFNPHLILSRSTTFFTGGFGNWEMCLTSPQGGANKYYLLSPSSSSSSSPVVSKLLHGTILSNTLKW